MSLYEPPAAAEDTVPWYVAYVRPFHEQRVAQALSDRGFEAFCPVEISWRRHSRRREAVELALFVRYLFVAIDHPRQAFLTVNSVDGVDRLLGTPHPRATPQGVVAALKQAQAQGVFDRTRKAPRRFARGQAVRVTGGPFTGFLAEVLDAHGDGDRRVRVLFKALAGGRDTPGVIDAGKLIGA